MEAKITLRSGAENPRRVLVAPLDWGLGHATRCIPIVRALLAQGCAVWLAGEPPVQTLLQAEFPNLSWLPLQGYRVRYGRSAAGTAMRLCTSLPGLLRTIRTERAWLAAAMRQHRFDIVISDNRYGLYHPSAHCVFITHQLQVQSPLRWLEPALRRLHYRFINRFTTCWVPDAPGKQSLAGRLSHPPQLPRIPVRYIGPLSRFDVQLGNTDGGLLVLLSGPEPQRSLLEQILLPQLAKSVHPVVLVRGLPGSNNQLQVAPHIKVYNHLPAAALATVLASASLVICRSGYSTIMDLAALGKKSILIPTPGQTEQTYLATYLEAKGFAPWRHQHRFDLGEALDAATLFPYQRQGTDQQLLMPAIAALTGEQQSVYA